MAQPSSEPERSLSAVLQAHRGAAMAGALVDLKGPCRVRMSGARSIHLHFALQGTVFVETMDGAGPVQIAAGQAAAVIDHGAYALTDAPGRRRPVHEGPALRGGVDRLACVAFGDGAPAARLLTMSRVFDEPLQALLRGLPSVLFVRAVGVLAGDAVVPLLEGRGSAAFAAALGELCLLQALRDAFLKVAIPKGASDSIYRHPSVSAAVNRINAAPGEAWTVPRLAAAAGMSRSAFAAAFTRHVGQAPGDFVSAVRMERALAMLADRRMLTAQIARRLGYRSPSAFTRAFRKRYGAPPGAFRAWGPASRPVEP